MDSAGLTKMLRQSLEALADYKPEPKHFGNLWLDDDGHVYLRVISYPSDGGPVIERVFRDPPPFDV